MISVSDRQLRIVAGAADLLAAEARGTFLRCVVAELRGRGDFSDCDVEQGLGGTSGAVGGFASGIAKRSIGHCVDAAR